MVEFESGSDSNPEIIFSDCWSSAAILIENDEISEEQLSVLRELVQSVLEGVLRVMKKTKWW